MQWIHSTFSKYCYIFLSILHGKLTAVKVIMHYYNNQAKTVTKQKQRYDANKGTEKGSNARNSWVVIYAKQIYRFCLQLDKMCPISHKEFKGLNWLLVSTRFEQCVNSIVFKFMKKKEGNCPYYLNEVSEFAPEGNISLRNNFIFKRPFPSTNTCQKLYFHRSFILKSNPRGSNLKYF